MHQRFFFFFYHETFFTRCPLWWNPRYSVTLLQRWLKSIMNEKTKKNQRPWDLNKMFKFSPSFKWRVDVGGIWLQILIIFFQSPGNCLTAQKHIEFPAQICPMQLTFSPASHHINTISKIQISSQAACQARTGCWFLQAFMACWTGEQCFPF